MLQKNNIDYDMENSNFYIKITNKIFSIILFFSSISIFLVLFSFHPEDPGWGVVSENIPKNFYGDIGSFLSGLIIREFGILPGLFLSSILFIWSLKLFNETKIKFFKTKLVTIFFMTFLSSLGGSYLEINITQKLNLNLSMLSQTGLSEWLLLNCSNKISDLTDFDITSSQTFLGLASLIISLLLFFWILSTGEKEIKFFKFIFRPIFLPLVWIVTMFLNLLFYNDLKANNELEEQKSKLSFLNKFKNKFLSFKGNSIDRKKPKARKSPILIKNLHKERDSKKRKENFKLYQDDLPLGSESGFILPSVSLLKDITEDIKPPSKETLDMNAKVLEGVLSDYSINGNIESVRYGPVVTRYDLQPAPGLRSQRVISLADDIARSMSVEAVRVAMVPGQNVIGIELPNKSRETVILRNILEHQEFQKSDFSLPVCLGKNIAGYPIVADLARMPHLLVAGTTGSGKSVGINAMILSLLYKHTPETCRLIMIDPQKLVAQFLDQNLPEYFLRELHLSFLLQLI